MRQYLEWNWNSRTHSRTHGRASASAGTQCRATDPDATDATQGGTPSRLGWVVVLIPNGLPPLVRPATVMFGDDCQGMHIGYAFVIKLPAFTG